MKNIKTIIASYVGVLVFAAIIYVAGSRIVYGQATLYLIVALAGTTLNHLLLPKGSDLTTERAARAAEGVKWDRVLLGLIFLLNIVTFIIAGMDSGRYHWSGSFSMSLTVAGVVIMMAGQILFAFAKRANAFFYSTVRIETKRDHLVCRTGPYTFVRHPGYLGLILSIAGFPLVLNSWWSTIPVLITIGLIILRTALEDQFLQDKLAGYKKYAQKTRWRLLPGVY